MSVQVKLESMSFSYRKDAPLFEAASASIIPERESSRGFITVVMGASGTGKSTLLKLLLGDTLPASGSVAITPVDARISYLSQDPVLFDHLSIQDNARYFERLRSTRAHFDTEVFDVAQRTLGLTEVLARSEAVRSLSGGERQRIALLRSISIRPALLLLDEPCRGLDPAVRQQFLLYLRQLVDKFAISVIYVTHHAHEARLLADHLVFLLASATHKARMLEGSLADFIDRPRHEAVAHTFSDTPLNRFAVTFNRHGVLKLLDKVYSMIPFEPMLSIGDHEQQAFMLFSASSVKWNGKQGIACHKLGETGTYVLANLDSGARASRDLTVVGPICAEDIRCFDVSGEALLFGADGSFIGKGRISETRHAHESSRDNVAS